MDSRLPPHVPAHPRARTNCWGVHLDGDLVATRSSRDAAYRLMDQMIDHLDLHPDEYDRLQEHWISNPTTPPTPPTDTELAIEAALRRLRELERA